MPCTLQVVFKGFVQKEFTVDIACVATRVPRSGVPTCIGSIIRAFTPVNLAKGPFHSYITYAQDWVGGFRKWDFLFIYQ